MPIYDKKPQISTLTCSPSEHRSETSIGGSPDSRCQSLSSTPILDAQVTSPKQRLLADSPSFLKSALKATVPEHTIHPDQPGPG
ncbi:hypothetical protein CC80DRAFT_236222 [Byssothecium circinans]|uniref:Uncharacterized protein n=1 Tax=Byssothecium circinans TaxID=147558 RepID=A0A6A5UBP3_9PLEO|nr:hypothetical protein CC80DRAFT_236222 [Byssothecium circinans]